jgi:hypothetical protein
MLTKYNTVLTICKIKSQLNINIINFGCNVHNCDKTAFDSMPVDMEVLVMKISVFSYTVCVEYLEDLCDFTRHEYKQILGCASVRQLSILSQP